MHGTPVSNIAPATSAAEIYDPDRDSAVRATCPAVLRIDEVAAFLTVSRRTVCGLLADGKLQSKRIGRRRVILRTGLEDFLGVKLA